MSAVPPELLGDLYTGTIETQAWNRAILGIADAVRASGALLLCIDPANGVILRGENHRLDPSVLRDYQRYWVAHDDRLPPGLDIPVGLPVTERTLKLTGNWRRSAVLNEFLLPSDVPYFMPAWLHKSRRKFVALSFQGTRKRGPFEPGDVETYRQIVPHVSRALEIRDRLECAQVRANTLAQQLQSLSFGVAVLDAAGKLIEANALVRQHLRGESGVRLEADGTLRLREPAGAQLKRWIATGLPPAHNTDGLLRVSRSQVAPLSVLVAPLPLPTTSWISGDPRWLLLIFDPEQRVQARADLIATDLGISAREAQVAALLIAGYNPQELATRLCVSEHTIRAQLKSIFRKTGLRSQSDLIRRVAMGPAVQGGSAVPLHPAHDER